MITSIHALGTHSLGTRWPQVIIGGGPAAALQLCRTPHSLSDVLLISESLGGMSEMLGSDRMQSYSSELAVGSRQVDLKDYVDRLSLSPTGNAYHRYIRDVIQSSAVCHLPGRVSELKYNGRGFQVVAIINGSQERRVVSAATVVLATGSQPKALPPELSRLPAVSCEKVYWDLRDGKLNDYSSKSVVILGCGNTAMQIALRLTLVCNDITILASRYVGLYPQETADRFAWRAASQYACELIVRSASGEAPAQMRYLIYDHLSADDSAIAFAYSRGRNENPLGAPSLSTQPSGTGKSVATVGNHAWRERRSLSSTVVVNATGYAPRYPGGELIDRLPKDQHGAIEHSGGRAPTLPGLFVAGACAGYQAVNFMKPAVTNLTCSQRDVPVR